MNKIVLQPYYIGSQFKQAIDSEYVLEELIDCLTRYTDIVIASKSTSLYLYSNPLPVSILKDLYGVDFILEGSIKVSDGRNVIATRVIRTSDESLLLNQRNPFDVNSLQRTIRIIAEDVYTQIAINPIPEPTRLEKASSQSESYYLKGLYHWNRYTFEELNLAISYFKKAIDTDKYFSEAYAALADCYCVIGVMGFDEPRRALQSARTYVEKALRLNNKRSESFVSAALVDMYLSRDYTQAKINLSQALLLKKNNLHAHHVFAMFYVHTNNLVLAEKHALLNLKTAPDKTPYYDMLAKVYLYQKKFSKGLEIVEKALSIDGNSTELKELEGHLNMHMGNYEKAIECYQACLQENPENPMYYSNLSYVFSKSNYYADSKKVIEDMEKLKSDSASTGTFHFAKGISKLGQLDYQGFFKHINIALREGLGMFIGELIANPVYNEVRKDKRFVELLKKLNLDGLHAKKIKKRLPSSRVTIRTATKEVFTVDPQHIAFVRSQGNYLKMFWFEGDILRNKLVRSTLDSLGQQLSEASYICRCHKSYLINLNEDLTISGNSKGYFFESNYFSIRIPISRARARRIINKYKSL